MSPMAIGGGVGLPALLILALFVFLNGGGGSGIPGIDVPVDDLQPTRERAGSPITETDADRKLVSFVDVVFTDVQTFWDDTFRQSGLDYRPARLVLFTGATASACGGATREIGPHYCPSDERVYLDLDFFRELRTRFGAPGDFAQAYVLAHELGHHVQHLLGLDGQVRQVRQADPGSANEVSIRLELQADCFAGVWAFTTYERKLLEEGDLEEGLNAAAAVGDDRIQEQATGRIDPESWTHGSSEQRRRWFLNGFRDGDPNACDTFRAEQL